MATTAQKTLGQPLTESFPIEKAKRDLFRAIHTRAHFHDHACNVAVSVAAALDWIYHLKVKGTPNWQTTKTDVEFAAIVCQHNRFVGFMRDWSNEFKHGDRKSPSKLFARFEFVQHEEESPGSSGDLIATGALSNFTETDPVTNRRSYYVPIVSDVDPTKPSHSFTYVAQQAIAFLEKFDATAHSPTNLP